MRILLITLFMATFINSNAQKMKEYEIQIEISAPKEKVWETITDFANYPKWNSILTMENNDSFVLGNKFHVTITKPNGKKSKFKAKAIDQEKYKSFTANQIILGKWFFSAVHHFSVKEIDENRSVFIQKWELKGIISSLFLKQIYKELAFFKTMNQELKVYLENN